MARVAVVTGGTRGIGASISKALKAAGYKVAATYAGNDEAAQKFKAETGIGVYKWDVANFDACAAGIKQDFRYRCGAMQHGTVPGREGDQGVRETHHATGDRPDALLLDMRDQHQRGRALKRR